MHRYSIHAALILAGTAQAALAQSMPPASPAPASGAQDTLRPEPAPTATPGASGASAADDTGIEEITVTAQRREEKLQDVPIAISAVTALALQKQGIGSNFELGSVVPGLVISRATSAVQPYLRGVGTSTNSAGNDPSVAVYLDGVYQSAPMGAIFALNNIARIEVLKGPQGTLFGRNATAGLIHIITRDPTSTTVARASVGYGNYNTFQGSGYVAGGSEQIAGDLAIVYTKQQDGWGRNTFTSAEAGMIAVNGVSQSVPVPSRTDAGYDEALSIRSKLVLSPGDRATIKLTGLYQYNDSDQSVYRHGLPGAILSGNGVTPYVYTGKFYDYDSDTPWLGETRQYQFALDTTYDADIATFRSISSYLHSTSNFLFPSDSTPLVAASVSASRYEFNTFTQELQMLSNPATAPDGLSYVAGLYFLHGTADNVLRIVRGNFIEVGQVRDSGQTADSMSAFGQATYAVTPTTRVTAGIRYTRDHLEASQIATGQTTATIPTPSLSNLFGNVTGVVPEQKVNFSNVSYRAAIDQKLSDDILLYGSVSRGYKAGSFPVVSMCVDAVPALGQCRAIAPPVRPEKLQSYEAGLKSELFGRRLRLNLSAFYYDYRNLQVTSTIGLPNTQPPITVSLTVNAAKARLYGLEADGTAALTRNFQINFAAAYLDTKYTDFPNATVFVPRTAAPWNNAAVIRDVSGKELSRAPHFTSTVSPDLTIPLESGSIGVTGSWYHNSGFFWEPSNRLREQAYDLFSAQISYTFPNDRLKVRVWGKNLTRERYYSFRTAAASGDQGAPAAPRTYGVALDWQL